MCHPVIMLPPPGTQASKRTVASTALSFADQLSRASAHRRDHRIQAERTPGGGEEALGAEVTGPRHLEPIATELADAQPRAPAPGGEQPAVGLDVTVHHVLH